MEPTENRSDLPSSRGEAKRLGYKHYFTGKPCKYGHVDRRLTSVGTCRQCQIGYQSEWRQNKPERAREVNRQSYWSNPERAREHQRRWKQDNPERAREVARRTREKNRDHHIERCREWRRNNPYYASQWWQQNKEKARHYCRMRQAAQRNAVPAWVGPSERGKILQFYRVAHLMSRRYNTPYEVDHVVPLRAKQASGLHCPANLQIIPAAQNTSKGNRLDPDVGTAL